MTKRHGMKDWRALVEGPVRPKIEDPAFTARAAELLPEGDWDEGTWKSWTTAVKDATGAKGKALFLPLRQAITGLDQGPEMGALLPLIGREKVRARLLGETA